MDNPRGESVPIGYRRVLFPGSSVVERPTVNRLVGGSHPALGGQWGGEGFGFRLKPKETVGFWCKFPPPHPHGGGPNGKARGFFFRLRWV